MGKRRRSSYPVTPRANKRAKNKALASDIEDILYHVDSEEIGQVSIVHNLVGISIEMISYDIIYSYSNNLFMLIASVLNKMAGNMGTSRKFG